MDISAMSSVMLLSGNRLSSNFGKTVLKMVQYNAAEKADLFKEIIVSQNEKELSVNPNVGGNIDMRM